MAQSGYTPISLYYSSTTGAAPTAGQLINGELAVNIRDGNLFYKSATGGINVLASTSGTSGYFINPVTIDVNTATLPSAAVGTVLQVGNVNNTQTRILVDSFGTGTSSGMLLRRANGTAASPTGLLLNDVIGVIGSYGYGTTTYGSGTRASMQMLASENWTDTAQGAFISFLTTPSGGTGTAESFRIGPAGQWGIGAGVYGTTGQVFTSGGASAPPAYTSTLTGIKVTPRINGTTSAASVTPNSDTTDQYEVTALATGLTVNAPSGTPTDGQKLIIRILDNGTPQTITWTTTSGGYRVVGSVLPTTTVANKVSYIGCIWNAQASYWDAVAVANET